MTDNTATQRRNASSSDAATAATTTTAAPSSSATAASSSTGGINNANNSVFGPSSSSSSSSSSPPPAAAAIVAAAMLPLRILAKMPSIIAIILRLLLRPVSGVGNALFPPGEYDGADDAANSDRAARAFADMCRMQISIGRPATNAMTNDATASAAAGVGATGGVEEHYVEPPCPFVPRGYNATVSDVARRPPDSRPLLLLYLHSPLQNGGGVRFVKDYLCHPRLLRLLNANSGENDGGGGGGSAAVACFGTSVHSADGQRMRDVMGVSRFPFLALLDVKSSSTSSSSYGNNNGGVGHNMELLLRMEGPQLFSVPPDQIAVYLHTAITRHAELLAAESTRRLLREEESRLRAEQDAEYHEALAADRNREDERRNAAERERREREEEEEAVRVREAMEESRIDDARSVVGRSGGEPPAGSPGVARLRFALPNGKRVDRRFRGSVDTIGTMRAFLVVHFHEESGSGGMRNIGLSTNFPRRTYEESDDGMTLEEAGLAPQAVVMVQDLDS